MIIEIGRPGSTRVYECSDCWIIEAEPEEIRFYGAPTEEQNAVMDSARCRTEAP
jgi:hypothetical protein